MKLVVYIPNPHGLPTAKPKYNQRVNDAINVAFGYEGIEPYYDTDTELNGVAMIGALGHQIFMPFKFESTPYQRLINGVVQNFVTPDLFIPIMIIEASQPQLREDTPVEGKDGTVKEFASLSDYRVSLKGMLVGDDGLFPADQMKQLVKVRAASVGVDVACDLLEYINVFNLVLGEIKWVAMPGYENVQAFEIDCLSDDTTLLKLANEV